VRDAVKYKWIIATEMRVPKKYNAVEAARIMRGEAMRGDVGGYQTAGIAKANILALRGCIGINSLDSDRLGDVSKWPFGSWMAAVRSTGPVGVGGEIDEAGDVVLE